MNQSHFPTQINGNLRKYTLKVPSDIRRCSGIVLFGKRIKSLVFSTDIAIIKNIDADAVLAVYPFTPQPVITESILRYSDTPVFAGVGGGLTQGERILTVAMMAEMHGASGVVVNTLVSNEIIYSLSKKLDIPVVVTVVNDDENIGARIEAGAKILNVSAAKNTPSVVARIKRQYPDIPVIATGGRSEQSIRDTIDAGANAISWTPPTSGEIFRDIMQGYREGKGHP